MSRVVFVYEYLCAHDSTPVLSPLRPEGWAMLSALLEDFSRVPGVKVSTLLHDDSLPVPEGVLVRCVGAGTEESAFRTLARAADWTLVIAPEFDDLLLQRCRWVEEEGGKLLGPAPSAVALTGDKLALAERLRACNVPTPPILPVGSLMTWPAVLKPRHGAGSRATYLVNRADGVAPCLAEAHSEGCHDEFLVQPFVPGTAASVAFLIGTKQRIALLPAEQVLSRDGRFHYLGGRVPLRPDLQSRAVDLAGRAVDAVPGLFGYVGVDLVLGDSADGSEDRIIEINPRPTTSHVGLRVLAKGNLAAAMLGFASGRPQMEICWRSETIGFQPDGSIQSFQNCHEQVICQNPGS